MSRTHVVIPDPHARPKTNNDRAVWVGEMIADVKPDVVVMLGDLADMPSLSSFDKGKARFNGRTYRADIDCALDFSDRMFDRIKRRKRKLPEFIAHEGNHEERISRALQVYPELEGTIGFDDLQLDYYYDRVIRYNGNTPGVDVVDGISYAHYFVSGVMCRAVGGERPAYQLLAKQFTSCTMGHQHTYDFCIRTRADGVRLMGLTAGCFFDVPLEYAGVSNKLMWPGVFIKHNVEGGSYDLEAVSMERLKNAYGYLTDGRR